MSLPDSITFEMLFLFVPSCPVLVLIAVYCALTESSEYALIYVQIRELIRLGQRSKEWDRGPAAVFLSAGHYCLIGGCRKPTMRQNAQRGEEMVMMKRRIAVVLGLVACAMFLGVNAAEAILINFTENGWVYGTPPPNSQNTSLASNDFQAQGIMVSGVYQYADDRDPWDTVDPVGLAPLSSSAPGVIEFIVPTNAVTVEWWFESSLARTINIVAYNAGGVVESFSSGPAEMDSGSVTLTGSMITQIQFFDGAPGAFPGVSSIEFEPVPEPATMLMLGCLGAGLAGATKLRRKK